MSISKSPSSIQKRLSKVVATVGPASLTESKLHALIQAGVSVVRVNFSHSHAEGLQSVVDLIKRVREEAGQPIAILGDLQGPKFRTGWLKDHQPIPLKEGEKILFSASLEPGEPGHIRCEHPKLVSSLVVGHRILINDGSMVLQIVERVSESTVGCVVEVGGMLNERKGLNFPDMKMDITSMSKKDEQDCLYALEQEFDFIALSFVQSHYDVQRLRDFIRTHAPDPLETPQIIAKIERPQALEDIHAIMSVADGIMVARGDMGVELRPECVPTIQKQLIEQANMAEKPIITATQMLESMIEEPVPTRAEVSDVANAVLDGSDALMLSAESAVGKYPVKAVDMMARIIQETERNLPSLGSGKLSLDSLLLSEIQQASYLEFHETIARSAVLASSVSGAKAIVVLSVSGKMAKRISKGKPNVPIIALTSNPRVARQLNLLRGVYPLIMESPKNSDEALIKIEGVIQKHELLHLGDAIVFCAGKTDLPGLTNTMKIFHYGDARLFARGQQG